MNRLEVPLQFRSRVSDDGTRALLAHGGLASVPEWLRNLAALATLDLNNNELTALPEWIGDLTALRGLSLNNNGLTALPESIGNLTALTKLELTGNQLAALPESIGNLTALTWLDLGVNQVTALPASLENLTALTRLDLGNNQLTTLRDSFGNLTALRGLSLNDNQLTALPNSFGNLTALRGLSLNDNGLTALPESIGNLTVLTGLDMSGNQLTRLPTQLADRLASGLRLELTRNPLDDPLPELVERGADALAAYLGSLDDAVAQYEAKLLLVGEGNVGKTSLVAALRGVPFVEGRPTTHGIEIWPLTFRHPALDLDMTLRTWDFGGQEVYRVTHQFFFSRRALYILVYNAREGQEQDQVEGWLRLIQLHAGSDARTMVVATHCAERLAELDYPHLEQAFPDMLAGSFEIDSRTGAGLPELREAIEQRAARLPQMGQLISPRWVAARDEILARAEGEPQIQYQQFAEVCERHGVSGPEIVTLAQLMHDLGHIIYYGEDMGLKDIVVLNPEWLTKAISYVLEDKPTKEAGGVLDHARLTDIWQDRGDGAAYPAHYHPYFLRLMEKFDVSYRLEGDELHSLVAQLVPYKRPVLPWEARTQPPAGIRILALVCRLSVPAPGLMPWLTVRHHRASMGMHWRRGVFLRHPIAAYASEALLEMRQPGELAVEVRAPSPEYFFHELRGSIEDLITRRWPGLDYQLNIPCPGTISDGSPCPGQFPMDGLRGLRENTHTMYPCIDCRQRHDISELLTGFTASGLTLSAEVRHQLDRIENGVVGLKGQIAETAMSVRRVLQVVSAEVIDCPRLFTLASERPAGGRRLRVHQHHYRLTMWCEHSGYWHPWVPASYELDPPKEWFTQIRPFATLIFRTLQLVVPPAGAIADVLLPPDQLARAQGDLHLMSTLVAELPGEQDQNLDDVSLGEAKGQLTRAEAQALRAIRAILFEHDRLRAFGGLRRVLEPSGDFLWVCTDHYPEYDPGLPTVPKAAGLT